MNWEKIDLMSCLKLLRAIESESIMLDGEQSIAYSDGKEELKISYRKTDFAFDKKKVHKEKQTHKI